MAGGQGVKARTKLKSDILKGHKHLLDFEYRTYTGLDN